MATLEEEQRRRRRGYRSAEETEAYLDHISRLLARQQGAPKPPDAGRDYYAPPLTRYVDPRDKYAGSGIGSGVANLLGGILQPGRASAIGAMNRQHLESLPQQQAQQSALLTDTQLEALKQKALDPNADATSRATAMKLLSAYMQALKPPSYGGGGGGPTSELFRRLAQEGGVAGRDALGTGERIGGAPGTDDPSPGEEDAVVKEPLTMRFPTSRSRGGGRERLIEQNQQRQLAAAERDLARLNKEISAGGSSGNNPRSRFRAFSDEELLAKKAERTKVENVLSSLEQEIAEPQGRPAAGGGGPGRAGASVIQ